MVLLKIQLYHRNWQLGVALNSWSKIRGQTLVSMFYFVNFIATHGGRVQISVHPGRRRVLLFAQSKFIP